MRSASSPKPAVSPWRWAASIRCLASERTIGSSRRNLVTIDGVATSSTKSRVRLAAKGSTDVGPRLVWGTAICPPPLFSEEVTTTASRAVCSASSTAIILRVSAPIASRSAPDAIRSSARSNGGFPPPSSPSSATVEAAQVAAAPSLFPPSVSRCC